MDKEFKEQLDRWGTESVQIVRGNISEKRQEERHNTTISVIRALMERIEGRQWLYAQLDMCKVFTSPFVAGKTDVTAFLSGLQAYGHSLLADIMAASPNEFPAMLQEEATRRSAQNKEQS